MPVTSGCDEVLVVEVQRVKTARNGTELSRYTKNHSHHVCACSRLSFRFLTHSFIQSFWLLNIILRFSFECKLTTKLKGTVAVLAAGLFLVLQDYYNSCRTRRSFVNLCALRPSYDK